MDLVQPSRSMRRAWSRDWGSAVAVAARLARPCQGESTRRALLSASIARPEAEAERSDRLMSSPWSSRVPQIFLSRSTAAGGGAVGDAESSAALNSAWRAEGGESGRLRPTTGDRGTLEGDNRFTPPSSCAWGAPVAGDDGLAAFGAGAGVGIAAAGVDRVDELEEWRDTMVLAR